MNMTTIRFLSLTSSALDYTVVLIASPQADYVPEKIAGPIPGCGELRGEINAKAVTHDDPIRGAVIVRTRPTPISNNGERADVSDACDDLHFSMMTAAVVPPRPRAVIDIQHVLCR